MSSKKVRVIVSDVVAERYARGWHCLGLASDYGSKPQALNYFAQHLVVYRGASGEAIILDGYCPHMGADLALARVEGDSLRCKFHAWRWNDQGICDDIPYADKIPDAACIKRWPSMERNGLLFVWHDPEGAEPIAAQEIPELPEVADTSWTQWVIETMTIHTHCRELVDNMADFAHFAPTHGSPLTRFRNIVDGHTYTQELWGSSARLGGEGEVFSRAIYHGPAYMTTEMSGELDGMLMQSRLLVSHVPIDTGSFDLRFGVLVKKNPDLSEADNQAMAAEYVRLSQEAFFEDVEIWHSKVRVDNPLLCNGDGPINTLRKWYSQFYVDIADVSSEALAHKTYELTLRGHQLVM